MSIYKPNDPNQRLRLQRFFMAAASYAGWMIIAYVCYRLGYLHLTQTSLVVVAVGIVLTNGIIFAVLRSGLNKKFKDPSLTLTQCVVGMCWVLFPMFAAVEVRGLLMVVYVVIMLFGIFHLNKKEFAFLALFAMAGYFGLLSVERLFFPERVDSAAEAVRIMVLAGMLVWSTLFGLYVGQLKTKMRSQNKRLRRAVHEVSRLAERDELTEAYNRRYIMDALHKEKARADRSCIPFSICIFDLDHFKTINDRFGHLAGDRVLKAFSEYTRQELRAMDFVDLGEKGRSFGRYGGEEFIVVLPNTSLLGAQQCAERIRVTTSERKFDDVFCITLSAGVAEYQVGESTEDTLRRADKALYVAKQNGRNQVRCGEYSLRDKPLESTAEGVVVVGSFPTAG